MPLNNLEQTGVSVVICSRNSSTRILSTLEHLNRQRNIDFPWEILLIDNNSTDNTGQVAVDIWEKYDNGVPLRVIPEPRLGTMYARTTGIESAHFRYLLYCDDDNWLNENYVKTAFDIIRQDDQIAVVGGRGKLEFEDVNKTPVWISQYEKNFGCGPQGIEDGDTTNVKGCLYTAGAILDRAWLDKLYEFGFKSSLRGRDGKTLAAGEDTELTYALKLIGGKLYYSSAMHFKHFMPVGRMNWEYLKKLHKTFGYTDFLISPYPQYFNSGKLMPLWKVLLHSFTAVRHNYLNAAKISFTEGRIETLNWYRYTGRLQAVTTRFKIFLSNRRMVLQLARRSAERNQSAANLSHAKVPDEAKKAV